MSEQTYDPSEMSLLEHLQELRSRLIITMVGVAVATAAGFALATPIIELLKAAGPQGQHLIAVEVTEKFTTTLGVAFKAGIVLSLPLIIYQIVRFVAPGLLPNEKRYLYALLPAVFVFFAIGAAFSYYLMVPFAIKYLMGFSDIAEQQTRISAYVDFVLNLVFWVGVSFETPLVIWFLCKIRVVTPRRLAGLRRYAIVVAFVVGAFITPTPDPVNQAIVSIPIYLLFELGMLMARVFK